MSYKILILSGNTGEGHNSAAKALQHYIESLGMDSDVYDTLSLKNERISRIVSRLYEFSVRFSIFSAIYAFAEWYSNRGYKRKSPVYHLCKLLAGRLSELITEKKYDAVVCTHLFPAEIMTHLRLEHGLRTPSFFISTDYTCYPFVAETDLDGYMIAHSDLIPEYISKGIPAGKIYTTGIPCLSGKQSARTSRTEARRKIVSEFWWDCKSFTGSWYLLAGGSLGFGNIVNLVQNLSDLCVPDDKIICVCGKNVRLKHKLDKKFHDSSIVKTIGYTDMIPLLMDACDVLLTKPGGLTSTEAINRGIPLIHTLPIKGIEDKNARFYSDRNISFYSDDSKTQAAYAVRLSEEKDCRKAMVESQKDNRIKDSCKLITDIIINKLNSQT